MISVIIPSLEKELPPLPAWIKALSSEVILSSVKGRSRARNQGAKRSSGDYLLFLDSDAILPEAGIVEYVERREIFSLGTNPVFCSRVLGIPREIFFDVGGFDESFNVGEDRELGLRLLLGGHSYTLISPELVKHREHGRPGKVSDFRDYCMTSIRFMLRYGLIQIDEDAPIFRGLSLLNGLRVFSQLQRPHVSIKQGHQLPKVLWRSFTVYLALAFSFLAFYAYVFRNHRRGL